MNDETWRLATGCETPDKVNALMLQQAEQIRVLADALEAECQYHQPGCVCNRCFALRLAGRFK